MIFRYCIFVKLKQKKNLTSDYACASLYSGNYVVTLSVDKVLFKHPILVENLVTFLASVKYVGNTSMEIEIKVISKNIKNRTVIHTNTCYFMMVAVDKNGKPVKVPELILKNSEDRRRFEDFCNLILRQSYSHLF